MPIVAQSQTGGKSSRIAVTGIKCYDCHSDQGTCNEGECEGQVCIKMETSNMDNGNIAHLPTTKNHLNNQRPPKGK